MDPVHGSKSKGRKSIGMGCLHVDDLFVTGTPDFLEKSKVKSSFKIGKRQECLVDKNGVWCFPAVRGFISNSSWSEVPRIGHV